MIKHAPIFDIEKVIKTFEKRDGVPISYVCTSDLVNSDVPCDIFYRSTPHPNFGNRYFGLFVHPITKSTFITNADIVETFIFGMIKDKDGDMWYSQCHHDCLFIDDSMIDGGRQYIRASGPVWSYKVVDGEFVEMENENVYA